MQNAPFPFRDGKAKCKIADETAKKEAAEATSLSY